MSLNRSRALPFAERQYSSRTSFSVHYRCDCVRNLIGRLSQGIGIKVRIAGRGFRMTVSEKLANDRQTEPSAGADAGVSAAQVMEADALELGGCHQVPRALEIRARLIVRIARNDVIAQPVKVARPAGSASCTRCINPRTVGHGGCQRHVG